MRAQEGLGFEAGVQKDELAIAGDDEIFDLLIGVAGDAIGAVLQLIAEHRGIVAATAWRSESILALQPKETPGIAGYQLTFEGAELPGACRNSSG